MKARKARANGLHLRNMIVSKARPQQRNGDGIVENAGLVDQLVRGAPNGHAEEQFCWRGQVSMLKFKCMDRTAAVRIRIAIAMSWIGWALLSAALCRRHGPAGQGGRGAC